MTKQHQVQPKYHWVKHNSFTTPLTKFLQINGFYEGLNLAREIELSFEIISPQNIRISHLKGWVRPQKQKQHFELVQFFSLQKPYAGCFFTFSLMGNQIMLCHRVSIYNNVIVKPGVEITAGQWTWPAKFYLFTVQNFLLW